MDKRCFKCNAVKPASEFYAHPQMADGRLGKCKECNKQDVQANYRLHRNQYAEYDRKRQQKPERRAAKLVYQHKHRQQYPNKAKARYAVSNAIRDGRLMRCPCQLCGATEQIEAHHPDYSRPLDVRWRCFKCHRKEEHGQLS